MGRGYQQRLEAVHTLSKDQSLADPVFKAAPVLMHGHLLLEGVGDAPPPMHMPLA